VRLKLVTSPVKVLYNAVRKNFYSCGVIIMAIFGEILQTFAEKTPVAVMVHGVLERFLNADKIK
jgi:hypothetical protein